MKPTKQSIKLLELLSFCIYLGWLIFSLAMWGTELMAESRFATGFLLTFAALIYILLCYIRKTPQIRMLPRGLSREQATRVLRLRRQWVACLKLIFVCGFAGIAISALFSGTSRVIFTILAIAALSIACVYYLACCREVLKKRLAVVSRANS